MEILQRKQMLKNSLINFSKSTKNDKNVYSVQTDSKIGYWIYKGQILNNNIFNLFACSKVKNINIDNNCVYYVTTITNENQIKLFNIK